MTGLKIILFLAWVVVTVLRGRVGSSNTCALAQAQEGCPQHPAGGLQ